MLPANNEQLEKFLHENFKTDKEMNEFMSFAKYQRFNLETINAQDCNYVLELLDLAKRGKYLNICLNNQ